MNSGDFDFSYERILTVIVIIMCAFIVGYNVFYKPSLEVIEYSSVAGNSIVKESFGDNSDDISEVESVDEDAIFNDFDGVIYDEDEGEEIKYPININTATAEDLSSGLDGIGEVMADRIIAYRDEIAGFSDIEQLMEVSGIGESKFNNIKNYITVE